ncbi:MAG: SseB family protein [Paracoccaceae bacterium]
MTDTDLDRAHRAMAADPQDDAARLRFYEALADSEIFLLLKDEAGEDSVEPEVVEVEGAGFVLAFDSEERLADFTGRTAPYAALSGRGLAEMLQGQGLGLGLNLDVAPSSALLPAAAVDWLCDMLAARPEEAEGAVEEILPPTLPRAAVEGLRSKLARAGGLAQAALLAGARFEDGGSGHFLAFIGAAPAAESALAKAVGEAVLFSGLEGESVDVVFFEPDNPLVAEIAAVAIAFDLPAPQRDETVQVPGAAPGMDPANPPRLK